ncbi:hypothetical protein [Nocardioides baekrokdamisoli]|uniref:hypothetical protein n=1 Tax=Nocardioides baekrokdamisoli TaxID=1804624 RepID=UPI000F7B2B55|nr:hypothetical protein [Nocardioides baekrokdamisoli]
MYGRLTSAGIECAIGGALALGYHVDDPRGTSDIDLNVSVLASRGREVLELMPADVPWDADTIAAIERDDQVRITWPNPAGISIPLDLFFIAGDFHEVVRTRTEFVPMMDSTVRVLSATDLTVFKALFNRSKDWPDIESMLLAHDSTVDLDEAIRWVAEIVGSGDPRAQRLESLRYLT